jgi:VWFA-related protein
VTHGIIVTQDGGAEMTDGQINRRNLMLATGSGAVGVPIFSERVVGQSETLQVDLRQISRPDFPNVTLFATVKDQNGNVLTNLDASNFTVVETDQDGTTRNEPIQSVIQPDSATTTQVATAIVIDRSGSMGNGTRLADAKSGAKEFVSNFDSSDQGELVAFDNTVDIRERWTTNTTDLTNSIDALTTGGATSLFDAVVEGVNEATGRVGRSAVIVLADGEDNDSTNTKASAINTAQSQNVPVYTIGLGNPRNVGNLQDLANQTGGQFYRSADGSDLEAIYNAIDQSIANEYEITYQTTNNRTDGQQRDVELTATQGSDTGSGTGTYEEPCAPLPTASFDIPDRVRSGEPVTFDASDSTPNGGRLVRYQWDFTNDGQYDVDGSSAVQTSHTYTSSGNYQARLRVEKTCGAEDITIQPIFVFDNPLDVYIRDTNAPISAGETLRVTVEIENVGTNNPTLAPRLLDFNGNEVAIETVRADAGQTAEVELEWDTEFGDAGTDEIEVKSAEQTVSTDVTIRGQDSFEIEKSNKLSLAEDVESHSVSIKEKTKVESILANLTDEVDSGSIDKSEAEEAVKRLQLGEQVTDRCLQVTGPADVPDNVELPKKPTGDPYDEFDLTQRLMRIPIQVGIELALMAISVTRKLAGFLKGTSASVLSNVSTSQLTDALDVIDSLDISGIINEIVDLFVPAEKQQLATEKIWELAENIFPDINSGLLQTGAEIKSAVEDAYEDVLELLAIPARTNLETGVNTPVPGLNKHINDINEKFDPDGVKNGIQGSFQEAKVAAEDGKANVTNIAKSGVNTVDKLDQAADHATLLGNIPPILNWIGEQINNKNEQVSTKIAFTTVISALATAETVLSAIGVAIQNAGRYVGKFTLWRIQRESGEAHEGIIKGDSDPGLLPFSQDTIGGQ